MIETITIRGSLDIYSETGTEGGWWAVMDERGTHGEVVRCPWTGGPCPGVRAYWRGQAPARLTHSSHYGIWVLHDGERLRAWDPAEPSTLVLDWEVALETQVDQYAIDAKSARGLVIHEVPVGVGLDWFADLALKGAPAELALPWTDRTHEQEGRLEELVALERSTRGRRP